MITLTPPWFSLAFSSFENFSQQKMRPNKRTKVAETEQKEDAKKQRIMNQTREKCAANINVSRRKIPFLFSGVRPFYRI